MTDKELDRIENYLAEHFESFILYAYDFKGDVVLLSHSDGTSKGQLALTALVEKDMQGQLLMIEKQEDGD